MIKNVVVALFFFDLIIAGMLITFGVSKVELGAPFMAFMKQCNDDLLAFKVEIPNIPQIPKFESGNGWLLVLDFLINIVNGLSNLVNVIINILNVLIQLFEFSIIIIKNLFTLRDTLGSQVSSSVPS